MHSIFQTFFDQLSESRDADGLHDALANAAARLDLRYFAYLLLSQSWEGQKQLISNYPARWTTLYLRHRYERHDPVILQAVADPEPFSWGRETDRLTLSELQDELLREAAAFGIRIGFTIPIHEHGRYAALTFAADEGPRSFRRCVKRAKYLLKPMATCFHAHAVRKLGTDHIVDGVLLSPREFECLEWAARGKSAWEIGKILGISQRTAGFHLDNAKGKLGVRTVVQAAARLVAAQSRI